MNSVYIVFFLCVLQVISTASAQDLKPLGLEEFLAEGKENKIPKLPPPSHGPIVPNPPGNGGGAGGQMLPSIKFDNQTLQDFNLNGGKMEGVGQ